MGCVKAFWVRSRFSHIVTLWLTPSLEKNARADFSIPSRPHFLHISFNATMLSECKNFNNLAFLSFFFAFSRKLKHFSWLIDIDSLPVKRMVRQTTSCAWLSYARPCSGVCFCGEGLVTLTPL